jgi:hypothetical protein
VAKENVSLKEYTFRVPIVGNNHRDYENFQSTTIIN